MSALLALPLVLLPSLAQGSPEPAASERPAEAIEAEAAKECRRVPLRPPPRWSGSGAWIREGSELALVDVRRKRILRYELSRDGRGSEDETSDFDHPTDLHRRDDGSYLVEDGPTGLVELSPALEHGRSVDLRWWTVEWAGGSGWIGGIGPAGIAADQTILIVPTQARDGVVYALVRLGPDDWDRGPVLDPTQGGTKIQGVAIPEFGPVAESYFSFSKPLIARVGEQVYLLSYLDDEGLGIYELTPSPRLLEAFPAGFSRHPSLPPTEGRGSAASLYSALESSRMPRGLYARGDHLYLLTREPGADGTAWKLHQVDPKRDRILRVVTLPTRANHLFLVPGSDYWAVVEKGAVAGQGDQPIPSTVLIPAPWIEDPGSDALVGEPPDCRGRSGPPTDEAR